MVVITTIIIVDRKSSKKRNSETGTWFNCPSVCALLLLLSLAPLSFLLSFSIFLIIILPSASFAVLYSGTDMEKAEEN